MVVAMTLTWLGIAPATCRADFMITTPMKGGPDPNELMLFNSNANMGAHSFTASVGQQSGGPAMLVTAGTGQTMDSGAGFANIKPDGTGLLTSVTFTPQSFAGIAGNKLYNDFGTNGQLVGPTGAAQEKFTLTVVALEPDGKTTKTFTFDETIKADSNGAFAFDFEVTGINGETIQSVTFAAPNGIKESKQTEFSLAPGVVIPEPASMTLVLCGLACFGLASLRTLRRKTA
jgi:hypothetical protein